MTDHVQPRLSDRDRALLVGLADGSLRGRRRERAEARAHELPDSARLLERQRRVRDALTGGYVPAVPPSVAEPVAAAPTRRASRSAPRAAVAGSIAAVLIALAVGGRSSAPSPITQAALLAQRPATSAAPASDGPVLRADVDGVAFPNWSRELGWHQTGSRRDVIDGRPARTVFYEHEGHRLAYTILPGPAVDPPEYFRVVRRDRLEIALSHDPRHGGHDVAVFRRGGRTCVIAGHVMRVATLIELAAWTGAGAVRSASVAPSIVDPRDRARRGRA